MAKEEVWSADSQTAVNVAAGPASTDVTAVQQGYPTCCNRCNCRAAGPAPTGETTMADAPCTCEQKHMHCIIAHAQSLDCHRALHQRVLSV